MLEKINQKAQAWDHTAKGLSADFLNYGIELGRFKTGTPPRILGESINFDLTEKVR